MSGSDLREAGTVDWSKHAQMLAPVVTIVMGLAGLVASNARAGAIVTIVLLAGAVAVFAFGAFSLWHGVRSRWAPSMAVVALLVVVGVVVHFGLMPAQSPGLVEAKQAQPGPEPAPTGSAGARAVRLEMTEPEPDAMALLTESLNKRHVPVTDAESAQTTLRLSLEVGVKRGLTVGSTPTWQASAVATLRSEPGGEARSEHAEATDMEPDGARSDAIRNAVELVAADYAKSLHK